LDFVLGFWMIIEPLLLVLYARKSLNVQYFPLGYFGVRPVDLASTPEEPKGERSALICANWRARRPAENVAIVARSMFT